VAGGSGSGKTTVVRKLVSGLAPEPVTVLRHDAYYRDRGHLPAAERVSINFDHPDALETSRLTAHVAALKEGRPVEVPSYDFRTHTRIAATTSTVPTDVIVLDGILVLADAALRSLTDLKVYVDTDADLRFIRRLQRDLAERGRTVESIIRQYHATVRPMHAEFVEPSRRHADVIVRGEAEDDEAMGALLDRIRAALD
jgi:uridine kinase